MNDTHLKQLREALGLTQAELASRVGVRQAQISEYETGKATPGLAVCVRYAKALGVRVEDLLPHLRGTQEVA